MADDESGSFESEDLGQIDPPSSPVQQPLRIPQAEPAAAPEQPQSMELGVVDPTEEGPRIIEEDVGQVNRINDQPETLLRQEIENHIANRALRQEYSEKAYKLAVGGLCFWGIVLSATGIVFALTGKKMLSDNVLIAITTGVTVNVIAAFLGVIRGLFPSHAKEPNNPSHTAHNHRVAASKLLAKRPRLLRRQR